MGNLKSEKRLDSALSCCQEYSNRSRVPGSGFKVQSSEVVSSPHKIAEEFGSETNREFVRFLRYAKRSCTYKMRVLSDYRPRY